MTSKLIGKVTHYYDKIGVAVVDLSGALKVGDKIKLVKGDEEIDQDVESIQVDGKDIKSAKKGESIGLKVEKPIARKAEVYLEK